MTIKDWKKCMVNRRELLGSNIVRRPRMGDKMISILRNGESGPIVFYDILPKQRSRSKVQCVIMCYNVLELTMMMRRSCDYD